MNNPKHMEIKKKAAHHTFTDVLGEVRLEDPNEEIDPHSYALTLDGQRIAEILDKNFKVLDPDNDGISREEISHALMTPERFGEDEYAVLHLLGHYFQTIANLSEDEEGPQTHITEMDKDVLNQFLRYTGMTLADIHRWREAARLAELEENKG